MRRSLTLNYASVLSIAFQKYTKLTQKTGSLLHTRGPETETRVTSGEIR